MLAVALGRNESGDANVGSAGGVNTGGAGIGTDIAAPAGPNESGSGRASRDGVLAPLAAAVALGAEASTGLTAL